MVANKLLVFGNLLTVDSHAARLVMLNRLVPTSQSAIAIGGNATCSGGRLVNYLKTVLGYGRHDLLFVSYQAQAVQARKFNASARCSRRLSTLCSSGKNPYHVLPFSPCLSGWVDRIRDTDAPLAIASAHRA